MLLAMLAGVSSGPAATRAEVQGVYKMLLPMTMGGGGSAAKNAFGVDMAPLNDAGGMAQLRQTNTKWLRRNGVLWSTIEPTEGARVWEDDEYYALEQELINASANGYQVILIVRRTPAWARQFANMPCGRVRDDKLAAFGNFMYDLVTKLSAPPYNVHHWELWNEPDVDPKYFAPTYDDEFGCYGDENDARLNYGGEEYAKLLQAAYPRIKQADPTAKVYVGGLLLSCDPAVRDDAYCRAARFLRGVLAGGGAPYFDGVSYHGYDYFLYNSPDGVFASPDWASSWSTTGTVVGAKTRYVRNLLSQYDVTGKQLIFSEGSLICVDSAYHTCTQAQRGNNYEDNKALYVPKVLAESMAEGVDVVIWHSLRDAAPPQFEQFGAGLLNYDLTARTAFQMYQYTTLKLAGMTFVEKATPAAGLVVYKFSGGGRTVWITWTMTSTAQTLALPSVPTSIGNPFSTVTPATSISVNIVPLFIEWR